MNLQVEPVTIPVNPSRLDGLGNLYQEVIVDHARRPRGKGRPNNCRYCQEGKNPLCGDEITIFCQVDNPETTTLIPKISINFEGTGCSISQASASMMCSAVQHKTANEARLLIADAEKIYTGKRVPLDPEDLEQDVEALSGVSKFPVRVKCAALAWKSLELLLTEHFDLAGNFKQNDVGCESPVCNSSKRLKVIGTEKN